MAVLKQNLLGFNRKVYERKIDKIFNTYKQGDLLKMADKIYMYRKNEWVVREE